MTKNKLETDIIVLQEKINFLSNKIKTLEKTNQKLEKLIEVLLFQTLQTKAYSDQLEKRI